MNRLVSTALVLAMLPPSLGSQTGATRYAAALATEKGEGDLDQAATLYRDLLEQYRLGRLDAALAARVRERLAVLGFPLVGSRTVSLPFQTLGERLGVTSADRLAGGSRPVGDLRIAGVRLRPRYLQSGRKNGFHSTADPDIGTALYRLERQIRALRYALGITGLLEYVEELAQHSRRIRLPGPYEIYQQGVFAERQEGDLARAAELYEQALAAAFVPAQLRHQLTRRLTECLTHLEQRGGHR